MLSYGTDTSRGQPGPQGEGCRLCDFSTGVLLLCMRFPCVTDRMQTYGKARRTLAHFSHWFSKYVMRTQKPAHKMIQSSSYTARQVSIKTLHWLHRQEKVTHARLHLETQQTQTVRVPERLSSQLSGRKLTWTGTAKAVRQHWTPRERV